MRQRDGCAESGRSQRRDETLAASDFSECRFIIRDVYAGLPRTKEFMEITVRAAEKYATVRRTSSKRIKGGVE